MGRERIVSLQILRFLAAMMVTLFHVRYLVPAVTGAPGHGESGFLQIGDAGVDIFFVLSGFVIAVTGPLAAPRPSAALFFWRRWRRVAPVYFILSAPMIYAAWRSGAFTPVYFILSAPMIYAAWRSGAFTPGLAASTFLFWPLAGGRPVMPALSVGWTLCFEMTFYAAMAALLLGGRFRRNLAIAAAIYAVVLAGNRLVWRTPLGDWLSNALFVEFALGVALAAGRARLAALGPLIGAGLVALALAWFVALGLFVGLDGLDPRLAILDGSRSLARVEIFAAPAMLIVAGAIAAEPWVKGPLARLLAAGGDASFSIYLTNLYAMHIVVGLWLARHWPADRLVMGALGAALAWGGGLLIYRWIERPILRDLKALRSAPPRALPAA